MFLKTDSFVKTLLFLYSRKLAIGDHQLCVGGVEGEDSCNGDSGGPLMRIKNGFPPKWYLIGIVSFGADKCGSKDYPAIYTKVSSFREWILDVLEKSMY